MNKTDAEAHALPQGIVLNKEEAIIKHGFMRAVEPHSNMTRTKLSCICQHLSQSHMVLSSNVAILTKLHLNV